MRLRAIGTAKSYASMPLYTDLYMALDRRNRWASPRRRPMPSNAVQPDQNPGAGGRTPKPNGCIFACHVVQTGSRVPRSYQSVASMRASSCASTSCARPCARPSRRRRTTRARPAPPLPHRALRDGPVRPERLDLWPYRDRAARRELVGPPERGGGHHPRAEQPRRDRRQLPVRALAICAARIPASGDGSTQAQARAFLFIVTDGLRDVPGPCWGGHCTAAFDPAACQTYKNANITVGVIYTNYLPILRDPNNPASGLLTEYCSWCSPTRRRSPRTCGPAPRRAGTRRPRRALDRRGARPDVRTRRCSRPGSRIEGRRGAQRPSAPPSERGSCIASMRPLPGWRTSIPAWPSESI